MKLYEYWRSGTSYRVRIALAIKQVCVEHVHINLLEHAHRDASFLAINPQGLVPALELDDGRVLTQSPAILEYLDDAYEGPSLFPEDTFEKAQARQYASLIACDIHPVQNLRVLKYLQDDLRHGREEAFAFAAHWIEVGLGSLEKQLETNGWEGPFTLGERPMAPDCYLLPQLYAGRRFGADLSSFQRLLKIEQALGSVDTIAATHPDRVNPKNVDPR